MVQIDRDGTDDIFDALEKGSLKGVKYWYSKDPTFIHREEGNYYYWTPLVNASLGGHPDIVKFLLSKGAELEREHSQLNATPLGYASLHGCVPEIKASLMDNRPNIKHQNKSKWTRFIRAIFANPLPEETEADNSLSDNHNYTTLLNYATAVVVNIFF